MEPALIYAASRSLHHRLKWTNVSSDTEWMYFGSGNEINHFVVLQKIKAFFSDPTVLIAIDRKDSFIASIEALPELLGGILGCKNFLIWDVQFKQALELNHIGVMRQGYI